MLREIFYLSVFFILFGTIENFGPRTSTIYDQYRVAVVQYRAATENDPDVETLSDAVKKNVENYKQIIKNAKEAKSIKYVTMSPATLNNVTMIVFPEYGLTVLPNVDSKNFSTTAKRYVYKNSEVEDNTKQKLQRRELREDYKIIKKIRASLADVASVIPDPEERISPCDDNTTYSESLRNISCAARQNSMYVVINHIERVKCKPLQCAQYLDDYLLHNTNVIFDRNGTVIARYRKFYVHHEPWLDKISTPDVSIFTTDFNVTFAQLIGIDILRKGPTKKILDFENITDIIYSTHRWDDLWLLNTKHDLYRWAYEYNADLMISGSCKDGGSDMVAGRDGPVYVFDLSSMDSYFYRGDFSKRRLRRDCIINKPFTYLQLGEVRSGLLKTSERVLPPSIWLIEDNSSFVDFFNDGLMDSRLLEFKNSSQSENLCIKDFCCYFEYHTTFNESEYYQKDSVYYRHRLVIFKTFYEFYDKSIVAIEMCGLIACTSEKPEDCGKQLTHAKHQSIVEPLMINTLVITRYMVPDINSYVAPIASRKSEKKNVEYIAKQNELFSFIKSGSHYSTLLVLSLNIPEDDLTFFGINVRIFDVTNMWTSIKPPASKCSVMPDYPTTLIWLLIIVILVIILLVWFNRHALKQKLFRQTLLEVPA